MQLTVENPEVNTEAHTQKVAEIPASLRRCQGTCRSMAWGPQKSENVWPNTYKNAMTLHTFRLYPRRNIL